MVEFHARVDDQLYYFLLQDRVVNELVLKHK